MCPRRSTIYAAYDFFRAQAGAEYFWDGDILPRRPDLGLTGCDIAERPHFGHGGLRYVAHRGPHRFHAEMWDFEDWTREIDWILKKRMNLFMLRAGIDDLFQRAFDARSAAYSARGRRLATGRRSGGRGG